MTAWPSQQNIENGQLSCRAVVSTAAGQRVNGNGRVNIIEHGFDCDFESLDTNHELAFFFPRFTIYHSLFSIH